MKKNPMIELTVDEMDESNPTAWNGDVDCFTLLADGEIEYPNAN